MRISRHVTESSGKRQISPQRPQLGNLEGYGLVELLRERWRPLEIEHL
jgi:hypothetical protein